MINIDIMFVIRNYDYNRSARLVVPMVDFMHPCPVKLISDVAFVLILFIYLLVFYSTPIEWRKYRIKVNTTYYKQEQYKLNTAIVYKKILLNV